MYLAKIFQLVLFGYGIGLLYMKNDKECNPKKDSYNSDGSIEKFEIEFCNNKYSNPQIVLRLFWNHTIVFRIYLKR